MVPLAAGMAIPFGVLAGVYVHEFGSARVGRGIRFAADVLVGIPWIPIGIFVYTILVLPFKQYNPFAGSVALAIIMIPVMMRTTEEIWKLVPCVTARSVAGARRPSLADDALGRRADRASWRAHRDHAGRRPGGWRDGTTAVHRPWQPPGHVGDFSKPMDALPLFIYTNARQPYELQNQQAWGAGLPAAPVRTHTSTSSCVWGAHGRGNGCQ